MPTQEFFLKTLSPLYASLRADGLRLSCADEIRRGLEQNGFSSRRRTQIVQGVFEALSDPELVSWVKDEYERILQGGPQGWPYNLAVVNMAETISELHTPGNLVRVLPFLDGSWDQNNTWNGIIQRCPFLNAKTTAQLSDEAVTALIAAKANGPRAELIRFIALS